MSKLLTQNLWRHHQPIAPNIKYGCKPNKSVRVDLREELMQGARPLDAATLVEHSSQMGYLCDYMIDVDPVNGQIQHSEDGRYFWYIPDEGFTGEDVVSYRIINVMNQVSEPACITFIVNIAMNPERIVDIPVKALTAILQSGDASYWVEDNNSRKLEIDRSIWAYNIIPKGNYVLVLSGTWWGQWDVVVNYGFRSYVEPRGHSGKIATVTLGTYYFEDEADFRRIEFTAKIDYATLGMHAGWPNHADGTSIPYKAKGFNVGFTLAPVGDTRIYAESSNTLLLIDGDYDQVERVISDSVKKRLTGGSVGVANSAFSVRRGVLLVNGLDSIVFGRTAKTSGKVLLRDVTYDETLDGTTQADVQNLTVHDPWKPTGSKVNENLTYEIAGTEKNAVLTNLMITVTNITRAKGTIALVAHVTELKAILKVPGWTPRFLGQDGTKYIEVPEYGGFVILEHFKTETSGAVPTTSISIQRGFSANLEWMLGQESCLTEHEDLRFYPIDLTKIRGLMVVPLTGSGHVEGTDFMSSPFIPFVTNLTTNTYTDVVANTYNTVYAGDGTIQNPPSVFLPSYLSMFKRNFVQAPEAIISMVRPSNDKYRLRWRVVPAKQFTNGTMTQDQVLEAVQEHKVTNRVSQLQSRILRGTNFRAVYEHMFDETVRLPDTPSEMYPEVISIREMYARENQEVDGVGNYFDAALLVIDFERNGATQNPGSVDIRVFNAMTGGDVYNSSVVFNNPEDSYTFVVGYIHKAGTTLQFIEAFSTLQD